jgi:hypothetical protein
MQGLPNRMGLGMRPPVYGMGQGPSMSALAQQQQMANNQFVPPQAPRPQHNLFVGSISGGITDAMLTELLNVRVTFSPSDAILMCIYRHAVKCELSNV